MRDKVLAWPEQMWWRDQRRQTEFRNVHAQTQSVILIFCEGWPNPKVSYHDGWKYLAEEAQRLMDTIITEHYAPGGQILRAMLARLPAGAQIVRHRDVDPSFAASYRIHVPLQTNHAVAFNVGAETLSTSFGNAFELNNLLPHEVLNRGTTHRIHFIFDYLPPPETYPE